jgi:hypothetical protein
LHQDEAGRWVSDNGRYLWSGSEWIDLATPDAAEDASLDDHSDDAESAAPVSPNPVSPEAPVSPDAPVSPGTLEQPHPAESDAAAPPGTRHRRPRPRRRGLFFFSLLLLVVVGVAAVLIVGSNAGHPPTSHAPSADPGQASPGGLASSPSASPELDEGQRRNRAEAALISSSDIPVATEQRAATPTDVFLPCRATALAPTEGTVLVGRTVSNSDFTVYIGQTIAGYPSARAASEALDRVRDAVAKCAPYDYRYANSPRIDRITHSDVGSPIDIGDGGLYLAEIDTPSNYAGSPTAYSYGYVRRGQFLIRLTTTNSSQADRPGLERLLKRMVDELG